MKSDDMDRKMRVFETANDLSVLPGIHVVARLDGKNFTRLTKERHQFEVPFDSTFRDLMTATTQHVMDCGFKIIYGYTESDGISLLFSPEEDSFNRKLRKWVSLLAGEASAKFSLLLDDIGCFDCRIAQLPTEEDVIDYFRWRSEDAWRNALNAYCYWTLRTEGKSAAEATKLLRGTSITDKTGMLLRQGIDINAIPNWQKRGTGLYWETYDKPGWNPIKNQEEKSPKKRIKIEYDLPIKEGYDHFISSLLHSS